MSIACHLGELSEVVFFSFEDWINVGLLGTS